jgi:hypothetical protein
VDTEMRRYAVSGTCGEHEHGIAHVGSSQVRVSIVVNFTPVIYTGVGINSSTSGA